MVELLNRMREVERLIAYQAPFDEVIAKIDECLQPPAMPIIQAAP
jgi:hypothetical protein